jgi:hypothetical protein
MPVHSSVPAKHTSRLLAAGALALSTLAVAVPGLTAQNAQQGSSTRPLQLRADPPPAQPAEQPFGYPGVPAGGARRVIINSQPAQPVQPVAPPPATMQRDSQPRDRGAMVLNAEPAPAPAQQPFGYPGPNQNSRVIIIGPAPTQSFSGAGPATPPGALPQPPGWSGR